MHPGRDFVSHRWAIQERAQLRKDDFARLLCAMRSALIKFWPVCAMLWFCLNANGALLKRVAPFEGQMREGFENITAAELTNGMSGLASFTGPGLTVQDGTSPNYWDQHAFEENFFLGGSAGRAERATVEVTFTHPICGFGGSFGHRVHPLMDTTQETEFVFYDRNGKVVGRDKLLIGALPGAVSAHWQFTRGVQRVTFTCVAPMADALTARLSNVCYRRFARSAAGAEARR
jgi:hypothetical protein